MAYLEKDFDFSNFTPSVSQNEVLPPGKYNVEIIASELRSTKDGRGKYLWIDMVVIDGNHNGRHVFDRLNIHNTNETARRIADERMGQIGSAVGAPLAFNDSDVLHNKPFCVTLKVRPEGPDKSGTFREAQNEVRGYGAVGSTSSSPPAAHAAPKAASSPLPPPMKTTTAPWKRN